jgi:hypothetical protein
MSSKTNNILAAHKILARGEMAARKIADNVEGVKGLKALIWDFLCLARAAALRSELEPEWVKELVQKQETYNNEHPRQDGKAHYPVDPDACAMLALVLYTGKMKKAEKPATPAEQPTPATPEGKSEF